MSGIDIESCNCEVNTDGVCECNLTQMHLACGRNSLEVYEALPETGVVGTTYFIGDNAQGYTEYVWNPGSGFVEMGTAAATTINQMTLDVLGLGKLSTGQGLVFNTTGGAVGMNGEGQLLARVATYWDLGTVRTSTPDVLTTTIGEDNFDVVGGEVGLSESKQLVARAATLNRYGAVRLGSEWQRSNTGEFVVGIGVSSNPGLRGQLCFNLAEKQPLSDGTGFTEETGCLRYRIKPGTSIANGDLQYEMFVTTGSYAQLGVVKLLHSLSDYTDEEIEACRTTHAASVGLVLDGLDDFCEKWVNLNAKDYLYSWYIDQTGLTEELWGLYSGNIIVNVGTRLTENVTFLTKVRTYTDAKATEWLAENVTDTYLDGLFGGRIDSLAEKYWNDEIDKNIQMRVEEKVSADFQAELTTHLAKKENVATVAKAVVDDVKGLIAGDDEFTTGLIVDIMSGKEKLELGGIMTTVPEYIDKKISTAVKEYSAELAALKARVNPTDTQRRIWVLTNRSGTMMWDTRNPWTSGSYERRIPLNTRYTNSISLPPGTYTVRLSSMPIAPIHYGDRKIGFIANMYDEAGNIVGFTSYVWYGDTGEGNDEWTAAYNAGCTQITVPSNGVYNFSVEVVEAFKDRPAYCNYVMVEFI